MFVEFVSLGDTSRRMFDDGAGMHEYLLCTGIVVVSASDPKDLSCYKLSCHYFLHLLSTLCTHNFPISCILLCCSEEGEYFDEDFF
jgi:hypothetical protein